MGGWLAGDAPPGAGVGVTTGTGAGAGAGAGETTFAGVRFGAVSEVAGGVSSTLGGTGVAGEGVMGAIAGVVAPIGVGVTVGGVITTGGDVVGGLTTGAGVTGAGIGTGRVI